MVGNLTFEDPAKAPEISNEIFKSDNGRISDVSKARQGRFLLHSSQYRTLADHTGFNELRVRCFKPWHGRTGHFIIKGDYMTRIVLQSTKVIGMCEDNGVRFLEDDISIIKTRHCSQWRSKYHPNTPLYDHLFWVGGSPVYLLRHARFECDDWGAQQGFTQTGSWQFFVR